ncbi:SRPBCC family protein [Streptomyces atratus]|uniref:Polyketide cyclase / dehydrase and lipid transport n=1 Tax=Streptomyces atratus TaxID=1893 RepID=A0A1K1ZDD4_STRAR|nr:SRPBCC family protein [Streptomyces atratus]SFX71549.1 Polyketide cyclase / dehydrase and lipid transport [Streptomyces atratus]
MTRTETNQPTAEKSGADRLREEASNFLSAQVERLTEKAGDKLTDVTGQLTDVAESGSLPAIGTRILQGDSPLKAFVGEKAKGVKEKVVGKVKEAFGGGKGKRKSSGGKVMNIIEVLDVGVPLRVAYDHWTQYDQFSSFAKGVRDVSKSDEMSSDWKVKVGPSSRSFKATVQEQIPDDRIVWTSEGAKGTTRGAVSFHELAPSLTRIVLVVEYYPSGFFEKTGNLWRAQGRRMRLDFKHFQRYVSLAQEEPEGWRGEIRDGEVVVSHEDAMEEEAAEQEDAQGEEPEDEDYEDEPEKPEEYEEYGPGGEGYEDEDEEEDEEEEEEEGEYEEEEEEGEDEQSVR